MKVVQNCFQYLVMGEEEDKKDSESDWDADEPNYSPFSGTGDSNGYATNHDSGAGAGDGATNSD